MPRPQLTAVAFGRVVIVMTSETRFVGVGLVFASEDMRTRRASIVFEHAGAPDTARQKSAARKRRKRLRVKTARAALR